MIDANIISVFIGIESPNEKSLRETKKFQNVRPAGGTILDRVHKIQNAGIEVERLEKRHRVHLILRQRSHERGHAPICNQQTNRATGERKQH